VRAGTGWGSPSGEPWAEWGCVQSTRWALGIAFPPLLSSGLQDSCKKSSSLSQGFQQCEIAELLIPHGPFHPLGRCTVWGTAGSPPATPPWEQRAPHATHQTEERKQCWQQHVSLARQVGRGDIPEAEGRKALIPAPGERASERASSKCSTMFCLKTMAYKKNKPAITLPRPGADVLGP